MKKVMIGFLVLIPVIIMLVVTLVSAIILMNAYIGVDSVTLTLKENITEGEYAEIDRENNLLTLDLNNDGDSILPYYLKHYYDVTVRPEKATNRDVMRWSISGDPTPIGTYDDSNGTRPVAYMVDESGEMTEYNSDGKIIINSYCYFEVQVEVDGKSGTAIVLVGGTNLQNISIVYKEDAPVIKTGERIRLEALFAPVSSKVSELKWESGDESVLAVDANGVVSAKSAGSTYVIVSAKNDNGENIVSEEFYITVEAGVSKYGSHIYIEGSEFSASEFGLQGVEDGEYEGYTVDGGIVTITSDNAVIATANGSVTVTGGVGEQVKITNKELYDAEGGGYVLDLNGVPLKLNAGWLADGKAGSPSVTWTSSDDSIATVSYDGVVTPVGTGTVVITCTGGGNALSLAEYASVTLNIRQTVDVMLLELTPGWFDRGLANETVLASSRYDEETVMANGGWTNHSTGYDNVNGRRYAKTDNYIDINLTRPAPGKDATAEERAKYYDEFIYTVEGEAGELGLAYFDADGEYPNRLYFDHEKFAAKGDEKVEITVSVKAKYPKFSYATDTTSASITLTVVYGVQADTYRELKHASAEYEYLYNGNKEAFYSQDRFSTVIFPDDHRNTGFAGILMLEEGDNSKLGHEDSLQIRGNMYGNGYYITGGTRGYGSGTTGDKEGINNSEVQMYMRGRDITLSNITLRGNDGVADESGDLNPANMNGHAIDMYGHDGGRGENMRIEYSIIENTSCAVGIDGCDMYMDGCIVRNTSGGAFYVPTSFDDESTSPRYSHLYLNNMLMSNMLGSAGSINYRGYSVKNPSLDLKDNWQERWENDLKPNRKYTIINQTGFFDLYNWKNIDDAGTILNGIEGIPDELKGIAGGLISSLLDNKKLDPYYYQIKKPEEDEVQKYLSFGFFVNSFGYASGALMGETVTPYFEFNHEDPRLEVLYLSSLNTGNNALGKASIIGYKGTAEDLGGLIPGSTYNVTDFKERLHAAQAA